MVVSSRSETGSSIPSITSEDSSRSSVRDSRSSAAGTEILRRPIDFISAILDDRDGPLTPRVTTMPFQRSPTILIIVHLPSPLSP